MSKEDKSKIKKGQVEVIESKPPRSDKIIMDGPMILNVASSLARKGVSVKGIADSFGISRATLFRRMKENPALSEAIKKGRGQFYERVFDAVNELAFEDKNPYIISKLLDKASREFEMEEGEDLVDVSNDNKSQLDGPITREALMEAIQNDPFMQPDTKEEKQQERENNGAGKRGSGDTQSE